VILGIGQTGPILRTYYPGDQLRRRGLRDRVVHLDSIQMIQHISKNILTLIVCFTGGDKNLTKKGNHHYVHPKGGYKPFDKGH